MKPKVYIETSIIGYLTSPLSRDLRTAGKQQYTSEWWDNKRSNYEIFISDVVITEISMGNKESATKRLMAVKDIPVLESEESVGKLAMELLKLNYLPQHAQTDALHIATATLQEMDYLLTWNCKHIANATMRPKIEQFLSSNGYKCPVICTPEELEGG